MLHYQVKSYSLGGATSNSKMNEIGYYRHVHYTLALMCAKNRIIIFWSLLNIWENVLLDIRENVEWPHFLAHPVEWHSHTQCRRCIRNVCNIFVWFLNHLCTRSVLSSNASIWVWKANSASLLEITWLNNASIDHYETFQLGLFLSPMYKSQCNASRHNRR